MRGLVRTHALYGVTYATLVRLYKTSGSLLIQIDFAIVRKIVSLVSISVFFRKRNVTKHIFPYNFFLFTLKIKYREYSASP